MGTGIEITLEYALLVDKSPYRNSGLLYLIHVIIGERREILVSLSIRKETAVFKRALYNINLSFFTAEDFVTAGFVQHGLEITSGK